MGVLKRAWDVGGWILGGYAVYRNIKTLNEAKDEIYSSLTPEQQRKFDEIFGKLNGNKPQSVASDIEHIKTGT